MKAVIGGIEVNYYVYGKGPPIICLHGWNETGKVFLTAAYRRFLRGYTVYSPDLSGFGKSAKLEKLDFLTLNSFIDGFTSSLGLVDFSISGQCMGG